MKELSIENLHKTYGTKTLIDGIDFAIRTGDRVGLIGPNGTGKSSFLKVIAGVDDYDQGTILKPNQYQIAYLAQNPELDPNLTILETVFKSDAPMIQLLFAYEQAQIALEKDAFNLVLQQQLTRLSDTMTQQNAWDAEVKAKTILTQLGLQDMNKKVGECSGGEQKRVGIAQVLIAQPDLLILDEPTNHLDVKSVQWLEKYLAAYQGALILVTHDRYFLERVVNKIVELKFGKIRAYDGNYQAYLEKRAIQAELESRMQDKQDKLFQQELAWMRQGAKARTTKQQARIDRFHDLKSSISERHQEQDGIQFDFNQQRIGNQIIELDNATIQIDDKVIISNITKNFVKGDRVGIIGRNGIGKSTLLNTIAGILPVREGKRLVGQTVRLAYYRQLDEDLPGDVRVLTYLTNIADEFKRPDGSSVSASQMLEQFNFPRNTHGTEIKYLSGGEKRRLYLLTLLIQQPNVLLLDEPTNDLDIETLNVLEDYIAQFEGVVLIVSHDRYFLDKTTEQLIEIKENGEHAVHWLSYSEYLTSQSQLNMTNTKLPTPTPTPQVKAQAQSKPKKMTYQEKKEWETIEMTIAICEQRIDEINAEMIANGRDAGKLMALQQELDDKEAMLLDLYERYDYLSELAGG